MLRPFLLILLLAFPLAAEDDFRFVSPRQGARAIGEGWIELEAPAEIDRIEVRVDGRLAGVLRQAPWKLPWDFGEGDRAARLEATLFAKGYSHSRRIEVVTSPMAAAEMTVDWVEVPVRLRGNPAPTADDFFVMENGERREVREIWPTRRPSRFVFIIDRSLSMRNGKLDRAISAVRSAASRLGESDSAELLLFNHRVAASQGLEEAVAVEPSGGTALRDALASIRPDSRTIAIVISDGADRNSLVEPEEALTRVAVNHLSVHAIALGRGEGTAFLREVSRRTGGSFRTSDAASLDRALAAVLDDIDGRWVIAYQSSSDRNGWREIEVKARSRRMKIENARTGYFAE
ncbi:MAG TPA: hypothetical protein VM557_10925 [Thermoanaerobaculia bacterium]|nr:hypothetical protein [Thermoanaerobaculia bacterium]